MYSKSLRGIFHGKKKSVLFWDVLGWFQFYDIFLGKGHFFAFLPVVEKRVKQGFLFWVVVWNIFWFHVCLGKLSNLTSIFFRWIENHRPFFSPAFSELFRGVLYVAFACIWARFPIRQHFQIGWNYTAWNLMGVISHQKVPRHVSLVTLVVPCDIKRICNIFLLINVYVYIAMMTYTHAIYIAMTEIAEINRLGIVWIWNPHPTWQKL